MRDTGRIGSPDDQRIDDSGAEREGQARGRGEHARERERLAREEAEQTDGERAARLREEAELHARAAELHEGAVELQHHHQEELDEGVVRPTEREDS